MKLKRWPKRHHFKLTKHSAINILISVAVISGVAAAAVWYHKPPASSLPNETIAELQPADLPKDFNIPKLTQQYLSQCSAPPCVWAASKAITSKYGPQAALELLDYYKQKYSTTATGDPHEWAHVAGHQTAKTYGATGKAFLMCPTTFNYGCMHGFFEEVLGHSSSTRAAVDQICGKLETDASYSPKFKFYCYHGVGHGVMQSVDYDLTTALNICDSLGTSMAQDGCWQGVFMENINGETEGKAKPGIFLAGDPLAPCDKVDAKYQHECYVNHSAHLVDFFGLQIGSASAACLKADKSQVEACLEGIGLMVTNENWQNKLQPQTTGSTEEKGWQLCRQFPSGNASACVVGGVDRILQMDQTEISRATKFCKLTNAYLQADCFRRIGSAVRAQTLNLKDALAICSKLNSSAESSCVEGASS